MCCRRGIERSQDPSQHPTHATDRAEPTQRNRHGRHHAVRQVRRRPSLAGAGRPGERTLQAQLQARRWARAVDAPGDREQVVKDVNRAIKKQRKGKGDEYNLDKLDIYISI